MKKILTAILAVLLTWGAAYAQKKNVNPNFVVIYFDDLGYGDLSCYGATYLLLKLGMRKK